MNFIYIIKPVKNNFLETMTAEDAKIMSEHAGYLISMLEKGKLILAGPALNAKFGIAILETESEEEAYNIMINDPAVSNKVMNAELNPFRISFARK
ncbi:MAG: YciI family protein [Ignavibacteria bacterium]